MSNQADTLVINGNNYHPNEHTSYGKPKINKRGGKNIPVNNSSSRKKLYLSTPLMMTWGANQKDYDDDGKFTYDMSLQFPREGDSNYSDKTQAFLNNLVALEEKILNDAYENRKEWFNKASMTKEVLQAFFSPMLKYPKGDDGEPDKSRQPTLSVKIPYYDGQFTSELYDLKENKIWPSDSEDSDNSELLLKLVQKTQNVALLIECGGIWFASGKFGVTWRLVQAVVKPLVTLKGKCHIMLDSDERELLEKSSKVEVDNSASNEVADSEDEDNSEETSDQPVPEPVKKVKRSRKKNT